MANNSDLSKKDANPNDLNPGGIWSLEEQADGKKQFLMKQKSLKSRVDDRVKHLLKGEFNSGETVGIDFTDYIDTGTVESYLGNDKYTVKVQGRIVEVPLMFMFRLDRGPWQ